MVVRVTNILFNWLNVQIRKPPADAWYRQHRLCSQMIDVWAPDGFNFHNAGSYLCFICLLYSCRVKLALKNGISKNLLIVLQEFQVCAGNSLKKLTTTKLRKWYLPRPANTGNLLFCIHKYVRKSVTKWFQPSLMRSRLEVNSFPLVGEQQNF
jgi:hypothetical protein